MNDFYFSASIFTNLIKVANSDDELRYLLAEDIYVCEVKIDNEWKIFTEQLKSGLTPVTINKKDLIFLGTQDEYQTRYTPITKWLKKQKNLIRKNKDCPASQYILDAYENA